MFELADGTKYHGKRPISEKGEVIGYAYYGKTGKLIKYDIRKVSSLAGAKRK